MYSKRFEYTSHIEKITVSKLMPHNPYSLLTP